MFIYYTANSNYSPSALFWLCWHSAFTMIFTNNKVIFIALYFENNTWILFHLKYFMHKPITSRIRSIVDGSLVHCHLRSEFESCHRTLWFFFVFFFYFMFLFIYLFLDIIHIISKLFWWINIALMTANNAYPIELMHSVVSRIYVPCLIMSHLGTLYKC